MDAAQFYRLLYRSFPFEPTQKQELFFNMVSGFVTGQQSDDIFVLKGYAGTGKTTVISTIVNNLAAINMRYVLLAPTGRAAKVISGYSRKQAFTIHKKIYFPKNVGGSISFVLQPNKHKNTIFIVDEASMIGDTANDSRMFQNGSLLDDLITYVDSGKNCKLLLLGDTAQLPPVQSDISPALDIRNLTGSYGKNAIHIELDEVMRQEEGSGILYNATNLRELLQDDFFTEYRFSTAGFRDIVRLTDGYDIQDAIQSAYAAYSIEDTAFIVRSNKRANQYNQQIRTRILGRESELATGDLLMVVRNNYFWLKDSSEAGFIANGDIIEILEIFGIVELYGFHFARVKVRLTDYPSQLPFETVLMLDTINSESASLSFEDANRLYEEVMLDYQNERSRYKRVQQVKQNEYFNALQVKFAYAMTCHKSQGGQWNTVFIEQPYLPAGIDRDYVRWLYTALTRSKEKVYLIGFTDDYFEEI